MYKQNPKSPVLKALKGNQGKLPQHLQDAIKAAPESPAKQTRDKGYVRPHEKRQMGPLDNTNPHKPGSAESKKYRKDYYAQWSDIHAAKIEAGTKPPGVSKTESPAKQIVGPKPKKKIIPGEELTGKKPKANKTFKKEPLGPYKPAPKSPAKNYKKGYYGV